jgi:hypothetical protein
MMASGFFPVFTCITVFNVLSSNTVAVASVPLVVKPWLDSGAIAIP